MNNKKLGFTLAEVLITLAIIGVVAALTLPTLMSNYKKHVIETKLVRFYSTVNQALEMAEVDYGPREYWNPVQPGRNQKGEDGKYIESTPISWAKKYLLPYLKGYVKFEETDGEAYIYMSDGSCFILSNLSITYYPNGIKTIDFDQSTQTNKTVKWGVNAFSFFYYPIKTNDKNYKFVGRGIEPYKWSWDGNIEHLKNDSKLGCYSGSYPTKAYCTALIQANGWKIPNDYPYSF